MHFVNCTVEEAKDLKIEAGGGGGGDEGLDKGSGKDRSDVGDFSGLRDGV